MDAGPLDVRAVPLRRGVVQGEGEPLDPAHHRLDRLRDQACGDAVGLLTGRRHCGVTGLIFVAELGGADPTGDGTPSACEDGAEEQEGEPRGGAPVNDGGEVGEPLAGYGSRMRGCHGWLRPGCLAGLVTAIVPVGPAPVYSTLSGDYRMDETGRDPAVRLPGLSPSCHRCGAPLVGSSPATTCSRCADHPRHAIGPRLLRLARWKLRTAIVLIALVACASAWGIYAWRRWLADDRGRFYTHEETAQYQAFLKSVALGQAREAQRKAAAGGADRQRWVEEAASWSARANAHERSAADYRWCADLKQRLRRGGW